MDANIKLTIYARHDAFKNAYELSNEFDKEIEELFKKIYKFGESCTDAMDFESKFATSPLNEEYNNLFMRIGTKCPLRKFESNDVEVESAAMVRFNEEGELVRESKVIARVKIVPIGALRDIELGVIVI